MAQGGKRRILLIGSANMDLTLNMYKLPTAGETVSDDGGIAYTPGGKGASAAIAFTKLGADCVFATKLGADLHGQKLYNYYKEVGINTSAIKVDHDYPTGLSAVIREADGTERVIFYPGANSNMTTENIIDAFACEPDAVYLGFGLPFPTVLAAAKVASAKNIPIFIDASPAAKDDQLEALPFVEIFSPNENETYEYTGIMPTGSESSLRAALALYRRVKCKYLVIKQGSRGAFIYDGKHYDMVMAYRPEKTVDPTAAGDAFTVAMTLEYLRTSSIKDSVKFGSAAAAITISRAGAANSVPTESEVVDFMHNRRF